MNEPTIRIRLDFTRHLVAQLQDAARETGWESLLRDAEELQEVLDSPPALDPGWHRTASGQVVRDTHPGQPQDPDPVRSALLVAEATAEHLNRAGDAAGARQVAQALRALSQGAR